MALSTLPLPYFIKDILELNEKQEAVFSAPVRLKIYLNDQKIYVDEILVSTATLRVTMSGARYDPFTIDLMALPEEVSYEFDY